jgi:ubiquinone/menaquinone biosynthesis C-methylase UbiE
MYTAFASVYDRLMADVDYQGWAMFYHTLMEQYGIPRGKVCECACGTGSLTMPLQRRGFQMTGVDLSREMLWQAAQKARKSGLSIPFVQQDMRALNLHRPVDGVLATCDGVNYLADDERVRQFFERAYASVKKGGVFAFDISSPHKLKNVLGNAFYGEERDEVAYLWANRFDESTQTVTMDLTFFVHEGDELYRRFSETHIQKAHDPEKLKILLQENGFRDVCIYGDRNFQDPKDDEVRIHIAAIRE